MKYKLPKIEELFEAGVHFGHRIRSWHPSMEKYIFVAKNNIHIIDLEQTHERLGTACEFLHGVAKDGGRIIFIGTKKQSRDVIKNEANRCGANFVNERWLGGSISNFGVIKKNIDKLVDMMRKREAGEYDKYTKKERLMLDRGIEKLNKNVGGLLGLDGVPSAVFVIDPRREKTVVREATKAGIPVVALIDTNSDVALIDYPIPGNDDAIKSTALIIKIVADAIEDGYKEFAKSGEKKTIKKKDTEEKEEKKEDIKEKKETKKKDKEDKKKDTKGKKEKVEEEKKETKIDVEVIEEIEEKIEEELEEVAEEEAEKGKKGKEDEDTKLKKEK